MDGFDAYDHYCNDKYENVNCYEQEYKMPYNTLLSLHKQRHSQHSRDSSTSPLLYSLTLDTYLSSIIMSLSKSLMSLYAAVCMTVLAVPSIHAHPLFDFDFGTNGTSNGAHCYIYCW
jgi:hypothetical protein